MKLKKYIFLLLLITHKLTAQNLVPNPGFELVSTCNVNTWEDGLNAVDNWFSYNYTLNSPDIFHSCFPVSVMAPPNTNVGYSFANTGNAMGGLSFYVSLNRAEIFSVKLVESMKKDSAYCVSFWVKNAAYKNYYWSNLGLYFSNDTITQLEIQNSPHIQSSTKLDKNEWTRVHGGD